jgi:hypothetical protein
MSMEAYEKDGQLYVLERVVIERLGRDWIARGDSGANGYCRAKTKKELLARVKIELASRARRINKLPVVFESSVLRYSPSKLCQGCPNWVEVALP